MADPPTPVKPMISNGFSLEILQCATGGLRVRGLGLRGHGRTRQIRAKRKGEDGNGVAMIEMTIHGTCVFDLAPRGGGPSRRIFLAVPDSPAPPGGFPAIYMLDANAGFATFVETLRRGLVRPQATGLAPVVLVGIGYPGTQAHDRARRTLDFTAGPSAEPVPSGTPAMPCGGRDAFLDFIEHELKPEIGRRIPVDPARAMLFGHSLGGWFALDVMGRNGTAFHSYLAASPSLWWDEPRLRAGLAMTAMRHGGGRLGIYVGEWEQALAPWQHGLPDAAALAARRARRAMVDRALAFAAAAEQLLGAERVHVEVLAREDHASALPIAMSRALRLAAMPEG